MTHIEITTSFVTQSLTEGSRIVLTLISGERLEGVLSDSRVHVEKDENGDYKEETSRIGLIVGDGTFNIQPTPVFSRNILSIMGSEE